MLKSSSHNMLLGGLGWARVGLSSSWKKLKFNTCCDERHCLSLSFSLSLFSLYFSLHLFFVCLASRQNAELAKLRQDCVRLGRELGERTEALQVDEERRKALEAKVAAADEQLSQIQVSAFLPRDSTTHAG